LKREERAGERRSFSREPESNQREEIFQTLQTATGAGVRVGVRGRE
jgi:hypothetical protein